jgi:hypothetical protein
MNQPLVVRLCEHCMEVVVVEIGGFRCPVCSFEGALARLADLSTWVPPPALGR